MMIALFVASGGCLGALCRFLVSQWLGRHYSAFPIGTLAINLLGSFLLGWMSGFYVSEAWKLLFGTGFMGAFTTFSTFQWESVQMKQKKEKKKFIWYIGFSYSFGILCAFIGYVFGVWMK
jgi:CrcB protein